MDFYLADFFRVSGGKDHYYSFHGAEGSVAVDGLKLDRQPQGTYAGPEVPFGQRTDEPGNPTARYTGSGFHFLDNVERDPAPGDVFSVDWDIADTWKVRRVEADIHLRLTMLSPADDVALADGYPPRNKPGNPERLRYLMVHRTGENLQSQFISVLEPYRDRRFVRSIERLGLYSLRQTIAPDSNQFDMAVGGKEADPTQAAALKIVLEDGRTDYLVQVLTPGTTHVIHDKDVHIEFRGCFSFCRMDVNRVAEWFVCDSTHLAANGRVLHEEAYGALEGVIEDFTRDLNRENKIVVRFDDRFPEDFNLAGRSIYIENDLCDKKAIPQGRAVSAFSGSIPYTDARNAAYRISGVDRREGRRVTLDIGDSTLIRGYVDDKDHRQGYRYDIDRGARFRIPLAKRGGNA